MAITVTCHDCGRKYAFSEENVGKQFKCKECKASLTVESARRGPRGRSSARDDSPFEDDVDEVEEEDEAPRRGRSERSGRSGRSTPKRSGGPTLRQVLITIGVIVALLFVGGAFMAIRLVQNARQRIAQNQLNGANGAIGPDGPVLDGVVPTDRELIRPEHGGFELRVKDLRGNAVNEPDKLKQRHWAYFTKNQMYVSIMRSSDQDFPNRDSEDKRQKLFRSILPSVEELDHPKTDFINTPISQERLVNQQMSQLAGVVAFHLTTDKTEKSVLTGHKVVNSRSRIRRTRIGEYRWNLMVITSDEGPPPDEAEIEAIFASFNVVGFARPPELDQYRKIIGGTAPLAQAKDKSEPFLQLRQSHQTMLLKRGPAPGSDKLDEPPMGAKRIEYTSGEFKLPGWYAVPTGKEQVKNAALVYLHQGHALTQADFEVCRPFLEAGFVVLTPCLRGENGAPGSFEFLYGEYNDAIAAVRWVAQQPEVDPIKIVVFGHAEGGALAALTSLAPRDVPILLTGSAGGLFDRLMLVEKKAALPFSALDPIEARTRLLLSNYPHMLRRHFAYIGSEDADLVAVTEDRDFGLIRSKMLDVLSVSGDRAACINPALRAFLARAEAECRVAGTSNANQPGLTLSIPQEVKKADLKAELEADPYFKAPLRSSRQQPIAVGGVRSASISGAPQNWLAMAGDKGTIQVLNLKTGDIFRSIAFEGGAETLAFTGNSKYLSMSTANGKLRVYELLPRSFSYTDSAPGKIKLMVASDTESGIALATTKHEVLTFAASQKSGSPETAKLGQCDDEITDMKLVAPDFKLLAVTCRDGKLRLFDVKQRSLSQEFDLRSGALTCIAAIGVSKQLVVGSERGVLLVQASTGQIQKVLWTVKNASVIAYRPARDMNTALIAIACADGKILTVKLDDTSAEAAGIAIGAGGIIHASFSDDGKGLMFIPREGAMNLWDMTKAPDARKPATASPFGF